MGGAGKAGGAGAGSEDCLQGHGQAHGLEYFPGLQVVGVDPGG